MCKSCGPARLRENNHAPVPAPVAVPGEQGLVYLRYTGKDAKTEYGAITGARYPFWERDVLLVDKRDADVILARRKGEFLATEGLGSGKII